MRSPFTEIHSESESHPKVVNLDKSDHWRKRPLVLDVLKLYAISMTFRFCSDSLCRCVHTSDVSEQE